MSNEVIEFNITTTVMQPVIKRTPLTLSELSFILDKYKPNEIFNPGWSRTIPFIVITEYNQGNFMGYCNAHLSKTPYKYTPEKLFRFLRYQGYENCYIKT